MFNNTGVVRETCGNRNQILFAIEHQVSVGVVVDDSAGVAVTGGKKIVKAGTPLSGNLEERETPFTAASSTSVTGVLLHDVDVTLGENNGTLLIFGFVNLNRIDEETQKLLTDDIKSGLKMVQFIRG